MVLDFANEADEIKAAFEPYYETTLLSEATDPEPALRDPDPARRVPGLHRGRRGRLRRGLLRSQGDAGPALRRARAGGRALPGISEEEQHDFRGQLTDYVRLYAFLAQVLHLRRRRSREALRLRAAPAPAPAGRPRSSCRARCSRTSTWSRTASSRPASGKIALERKPGVLDPVSTKGRYGTAAGGAGDALAHHRRAERALRAQPRPGAPGDARPDDGEARRRSQRSMPRRGSTRARTCGSPSTRRSST